MDFPGREDYVLKEEKLHKRYIKLRYIGLAFWLIGINFCGCSIFFSDIYKAILYCIGSVSIGFGLILLVLSNDIESKVFDIRHERISKELEVLRNSTE